QSYDSIVVYFPFLGGWFPTNFVLNPGEGAMFGNPLTTNFTIFITGSPHVPTLPVVVGTNCLTVVSRQTNGPGTFENIMGFAPAAGPLMPSFIPGTNCNNGPAPGGCSNFVFFSFRNGAWLPSPPTTAVGEAIFVSTNSFPPIITAQPQDQTNVLGQ